LRRRQWAEPRPLQGLPWPFAAGPPVEERSLAPTRLQPAPVQRRPRAHSTFEGSSLSPTEPRRPVGRQRPVEAEEGEGAVGDRPGRGGEGAAGAPGPRGREEEKEGRARGQEAQTARGGAAAPAGAAGEGAEGAPRAGGEGEAGGGGEAPEGAAGGERAAGQAAQNVHHVHGFWQVLRVRRQRVLLRLFPGALREQGHRDGLRPRAAGLPRVRRLRPEHPRRSGAGLRQVPQLRRRGHGEADRGGEETPPPDQAADQKPVRRAADPAAPARRDEGGRRPDGPAQPNGCGEPQVWPRRAQPVSAAPVAESRLRP